MTNDSHAFDPSMSEEEIRTEVSRRITKYDLLGFFEQFAMFMGKAQILEFGLKNLLGRDFSVDEESMKKWTLGRVRIELKNKGLRIDFCTLLKSFVGHRNYIAHELLVNHALIRSLFDDGAPGHFEVSRLHKGIYELEQLMLFYDWCEEHKAWK
jgi:hypothetical protein